MNKTATKITASIFTTVFLFQYFATVGLAQSRTPLVVAPARQSIAIDAGKSENLQIKFFNESANPVSGNIKAVDFIVNGKDGAPILLEDQVVDWIKLPYDKASIPSGDVLRVNFKVDVPKETQPGARYVAIIFEQTGQLPQSSSDSEEASAILPRIVGLLTIRINGQVFESSFLDSFKLPGFLEFGPIPVYFEILNKGGVHITPAGQIVIKDYFGNEIDRKTIESKNIFPNARRSYEMEVGKKWMFGRYLVNLTAGYGETGKVISTNQYIWVVPVTLIIVSLLGLTIAIMFVALISHKMKEKQSRLEEKLEEEISELEALKNRFKDKLPK